MTLFVFEGAKREPNLFDSISELYDIDKGIRCIYNGDILSLYNILRKDDGWDLFGLLKERLQKCKDPTLDKVSAFEIGQIYLFFDYDCQTSRAKLSALNENLEQMLRFFNEETEHGKLYINYPMVEAIRYTKTLPDAKYHTYTIECDKCKGKCFKSYAHNFSAYKSLNFLSNHNGRENWEHLKRQNVEKANFICNGELCFPKTKADIAQDRIFDSQLEKFVIPKNEVSILSAFPVFLFDYFK